MKILISNTSDTPLYQQIKDQIKDAILKEELVEGDALPSIRAFANDLKVSVLTIRRVYEELEQEGFIVSQVGIGTFVSTSNLELLRDSKRRLVEQKMADMRVQIPYPPFFISYLNPKPFLFLNQLMQAYLPCCALLQLSY